MNSDKKSIPLILMFFHLQFFFLYKKLFSNKKDTPKSNLFLFLLFFKNLENFYSIIIFISIESLNSDEFYS